jgi:hypothetical protein
MVGIKPIIDYEVTTFVFETVVTIMQKFGGFKATLISLFGLFMTPYLIYSYEKDVVRQLKREKEYAD